jgi:hypothetical protein
MQLATVALVQLIGDGVDWDEEFLVLDRLPARAFRTCRSPSVMSSVRRGGYPAARLRDSPCAVPPFVRARRSPRRASPGRPMSIPGPGPSMRLRTWSPGIRQRWFRRIDAAATVRCLVRP